MKEMEFLRAIRNWLTCRECGKSLSQRPVAWRGRGTGRHGESEYNPTAFEEIKPTTHCTCVGGIFWVEFRKIFPYRIFESGEEIILLDLVKDKEGRGWMKFSCEGKISYAPWEEVVKRLPDDILRRAKGG